MIDFLSVMISFHVLFFLFMPCKLFVTNLDPLLFGMDLVDECYALRIDRSRRFSLFSIDTFLHTVESLLGCVSCLLMFDDYQSHSSHVLVVFYSSSFVIILNTSSINSSVVAMSLHDFSTKFGAKDENQT